MIRWRTTTWLLPAALALALAGCNNDMSDLRAFVAKARAHKVTKIKPIPKMTPYKAFSYDQAGRRDPFMPEQSRSDNAPVQHVSNGIHPNLKRTRQALEQYPLDALRMVGTLSFNNTLYAMVSAPDGVVHRVTVGDYMGRHYGRIVKITPTEVDLSELIPNGFGGWQRKPAKLGLAD